MSLLKTDAEAPNAVDRRSAWLEVVVIFLLFFVYAAAPTPSVNEAHYLAKARHYWDPQWCPHDHFLNSADAHVVFYWTLGWLTIFFPLPVVAWIGRLLTWGLLAWSWRRLSFAVCPERGMAVLSAGLVVTLWHRGHMAGEWVIGGVEAKGFAYVLVFLALEAVLQNRWGKMLLLLGAATSFHVLVGGWSLLAAGAAWLSCGTRRPPLKSLVLSLIAALLLALPGLVPALAMMAHGSADTIRDSNAIYVYERLGHHLLFHRFLYDPDQPLILVLRHLALFVVWLVLGVATPCEMASGKLGQRPLRGFVGGAFAIAVLGMLLDQILIQHVELAAAVMKYYWFRLSDALLPAGVALSVVAAIVRWRELRPTVSRGLLYLALCIVGLQLLWSGATNVASFRRGGNSFMIPVAKSEDPAAAQRLRDWEAACHWIRDNTPHDAVCITPRWQQTFKWFAQRAEIVTWKDVPQDPVSVVEWWQRIGEVYPPDVSAHGLSAHSDDTLRELAKKYNAAYLVLDQFQSPRDPGFKRIYPVAGERNESFAVYEIPGS